MPDNTELRHQLSLRFISVLHRIAVIPMAVLQSGQYKFRTTSGWCPCGCQINVLAPWLFWFTKFVPLRPLELLGTQSFLFCPCVESWPCQTHSDESHYRPCLYCPGLPDRAGDCSALALPLWNLKPTDHDPWPFDPNIWRLLNTQCDFYRGFRRYPKRVINHKLG